MRKVKINNKRRCKSHVFSKLFDRFDSKKKQSKSNINTEITMTIEEEMKANSSLSGIDDETDSIDIDSQLCLSKDLEFKMDAISDIDSEQEENESYELEQLVFSQ